MLNRYSSWLTVIDTITTNQTNLNLYTYISGLALLRHGWTRAAGKKLRAIITIDDGVSITSNNVLTPALTLPADGGAAAFRSYDLVMLINNGTIAGAPGAAGALGRVGGDGGNGGTAIEANRTLFLTNNNEIYGGGGGGGGGGGYIQKAAGNFNCNGGSPCENDCPGGTCVENCNGNTWCITTAFVCDVLSNCGCVSQQRGVTCNCPGGAVQANCTCQSTSCTNVNGASGGSGRGVGIASILGGASPGLCRGRGGNGGEWGLDGDAGDPGCLDIANTIDAGDGGDGGNGGAWIRGFNSLIYTAGADGVVAGQQIN